MITSPSQHPDEEDEDLLRKIAMESLKRGRENDFNDAHVEQPNPEPHFQSFQQPIYGAQPEVVNPDIPFHSNSFPSTRPPRMSGGQNYMRPRFINSFPPRHAVRPYVQNRMPPVQHQYTPQIPVMQEFVPIPHVNPQFLAQQPPIHQAPAPIFPTNDYPMDYTPTPAIRLSPRSAEFVAKNKEAIMKVSSKRSSRSPPPRRRRDSGSPVRRTRSPYKHRSPNENGRKRYRSKSPDNRTYKSRNNSPKVEKRSKSPRNRSQSPRNARFPRKGSDGRDRYNRNGRYNNRKRSGSEKEDERPRSKPKEEAPKDKIVVNEKEKIEQQPKEVKNIEKTKSPSPIPEEKSTTPPLKLPDKKEKTLEELEDELLASTDEEDGVQLDINMDDNELDFLEDDSESENEGRFKSKPSSNVKTASLPSKTSSYTSKFHDKGKSSYSSRNDYRRDDKYSSKRKEHTNYRRSPEVDSRKKSSPDRKEISLNKDSAKKDSTETERKPMFKSTFKSIDSGEKKAESTTTTTKKSVTLVRSFVSKPDSIDSKKISTSSSVKSIITVNDESSKTSGKKKIMERLGEFVGAKGKIEGNRSRATKQVCERGKVIGMKINGAVESKSMASRKSYCAM